MADSQTSGFLKLGSQALYGTLFPATSTGSGAVVLFDALAEEKKCAFRVMVRLARALAARGFATFHFDHSGSGESAGDQGRVAWDDWLAEAAAAAAFLQQQAGTSRWLAVGVRLGAFTALHAAQRGGATAVALVEPVLTGEECLRDLERRQRIKQAVIGSTSAAEAEEDSAQRWARGETVDFGGFEVGPRLAAGLRQESLPARLAQLRGDCPLQLLRVSGSPSFPPAWRPLAERAQSMPPGRAAVVRDKPFWGQLEYYESDLVLNEVVAFAEATLGQTGAAAAAEGPQT